MFNDKYCLTSKVLNNLKTKTRRIVPLKLINEYGHNKFSDKSYELVRHAPFKVGEEIAVAQSYHALNKLGYLAPEWLDHYCEGSAGYDNKMFVKPELMPYRIKITNVRVERLQDISDEDCLAEGVEKLYYEAGGFCVYRVGVADTLYDSPREAFIYLIDKISGKGTWDSNPYVFVYDFDLITVC